MADGFFGNRDLTLIFVAFPLDTADIYILDEQGDDEGSIGLSFQVIFPTDATEEDVAQGRRPISSSTALCEVGFLYAIASPKRQVHVRGEPKIDSRGCQSQ